MCLGSIDVLDEAWEDGGARTGGSAAGRSSRSPSSPRPATGPRAVDLGIPVEVLEPNAAEEALALRTEEDRMSSTRATGIALAFVAALISGVAIFVNGHAVKHFGDATVYTTAKNAVAGVLLLALAAPLLGRPRSALPRFAAPARPARDRRHRRQRAVRPLLRGPRPRRGDAGRLHPEDAGRVGRDPGRPAAPRASRLAALRRDRDARRRTGVAGGDAGTVVFRSGEVLILAATLLWAVEVIVAKKLLADLDSRLVSAARMALGTIVLLGWVVVSGRGDELVSLSRRPVELGPVDRPDPCRLRGDLVRGPRPGAGGRRDGRARLRSRGHGPALARGRTASPSTSAPWP